MQNNNDSTLSTATYLKFNIEKTLNEGEDADPILVESVSSRRFFIGVADGMGGSGSTNYEYEGTSKTGAYFASRITLKSCQTFFDKLFQSNFELQDYLIKLKIYIKEELLSNLKLFKFEVSGLKSKLLRSLPTTLAGIQIECNETQTNITSIWAGDSRSYILTANKGLQQISIDDLKEELDPFDNIKKDSQLKNFISADNDFTLNIRKLSVTEPLLAIVATDGCFGYFHTPMQFEYSLLQSLDLAETIEDWQNNLINIIKPIAGDDFSMLILVVGWNNDLSLVKRDFKQRIQLLYSDVIEQLELLDKDYSEKKKSKERIEEELKIKQKQRQEIQTMLWSDYKKNYLIQNNPK